MLRSRIQEPEDLSVFTVECKVYTSVKEPEPDLRVFTVVEYTPVLRSRELRVFTVECRVYTSVLRSRSQESDLRV